MGDSPDKRRADRPVTITHTGERRSAGLRWAGIAAALLLSAVLLMWLAVVRWAGSSPGADSPDAATQAAGAGRLREIGSPRRYAADEPRYAAADRYATPPRDGRDASATTTLPSAPGVAVVTGGIITAAPPSHASAMLPGELPVFTALRESRRHPIPAEVAELAVEITKDATNDTMRARAIYDWLTENIRYDVVEWAHITGGGDEYTHAHDPRSVLERGTTVCSGYSWLFDAMARSVGLESTFLIGDVRGYRGTPDDSLVSAFKHAWNAVQVDGEWRLLDATWGARQTGEQAGGAYLARRDYYFDTPAGQMIFDHLPEAAQWQLLESPLPDAASFNSQPNLKPPFFLHGLELVGSPAGTLQARADCGGALAVSAPPTVEVAATVSPLRAGDAPRQIPVVAADGLRNIIVEPLPRGEYVLRIYSRPEGAGAFACGADFVIRAE